MYLRRKKKEGTQSWYEFIGLEVLCGLFQEDQVVERGVCLQKSGRLEDGGHTWVVRAIHAHG